MRGNYVAALAVLVVALGAGGCGRNAGKPGTRQAAALADAVRPAFIADALQQLGGAHYHSTLRYAVGRAGAAPLAITTTTDVWLDRSGNYRLREENDHDGGREIVLSGRELAVALRYGRMIRRVAEEPEPSRLLEEGLGAPWAAFELAGPRAEVGRTGSDRVGGVPATTYVVTLGEGSSVAKPWPSPTGLRSWRGAAAIETLAGRAAVDDATGALLAADLTATFEVRGEGGPAQGTVEVRALVSDVGATPAIERPVADELVLRQRTVPEAHELLRGLAEPERRAPGATREHRP